MSGLVHNTEDCGLCPVPSVIGLGLNTWLSSGDFILVQHIVIHSRQGRLFQCSSRLMLLSTKLLFWQSIIIDHYKEKFLGGGMVMLLV